MSMFVHSTPLISLSVLWAAHECVSMWQILPIMLVCGAIYLRLSYFLRSLIARGGRPVVVDGRGLDGWSGDDVAMCVVVSRRSHSTPILSV